MELRDTQMFGTEVFLRDDITTGVVKPPTNSGERLSLPVQEPQNVITEPTANWHQACRRSVSILYLDVNEACHNWVHLNGLQLNALHVITAASSCFAYSASVSWRPDGCLTVLMRVVFWFVVFAFVHLSLCFLPIMFIVMHQHTKANSLYVKTYLAGNLILILSLPSATFSSPRLMHYLGTLQTCHSPSIHPPDALRLSHQLLSPHSYIHLLTCYPFPN